MKEQLFDEVEKILAKVEIVHDEQFHHFSKRHLLLRRKNRLKWKKVKIIICHQNLILYV